MSENRDPAIKLFGKTIPLPSGGDLEEEGGGEEDKGLCSGRESDDKESLKSEDKEKDEEAMVSPMAQQQQQQQSNNPQEKEKAAALKKPDKILPCPRCNSMDTKFCYYNNYNVNQPRHFCKNCQRYWTAGGTMRNVPVGAGRRKNKNTSCHYRHLEAIRSEPIPDPSLRPNATVLSFGSSDAPPLCDSMAEGSSNSPDEPPAVIPYVSWPPYPWNHHPAAPIPIPFYPAPPPPPYWATWTVPWIPAATTNGSLVTLGKHSREGNVLTAAPPKQSHNNNNNNLWFPKTLRIDDPQEAAKSSIWTTMGFRNDKASSGGGGMFEAFQTKAELRNHAQALHANPAAMSRSLNFQETS